MNRRFSMFVFFVSFIWLLALGGNAFAAARTASVDGNWNSTATWGGQSVPVAGDTVTINDSILVTVTANAACASITILKANSTGTHGITINNTYTLTVSGAIIIRQNDSGDNGIRVGTGVLNAASIEIEEGDASADYSELSVSTGTINVTGNLTFTTATGSDGLAKLTFIGAGGTLNIGGTLDSGGTFAAAQGTVNFNGAAQTIPNYTYYNLTLSGSGNKTFSAAATIGGTLSISGSAKANLATGTNTTASYLLLGGISQSAGTYGSTSSAATYKNDTYFASSTGIVTVNPGCSTPGTWMGTTSNDWNTGTNWCGGSVPTSSTAVVIPNTGITNWPTVSASGMVCNSLTFSGSSSRLNFTGGDLTVSGNVTFSSGVINASTAASTLYVGGTWTGTGTTFTPSTYLTVNFNGASQTIPDIDFYNLSTSGSGTKTIAIGTFYIYGNLLIGANTTLQESNYDYYYYGNFTNNGTYISGTGVHRFRGTGKTIDGTGDITINGLFNYETSGASYTYNGSGTLTAAGTYMYLGATNNSFTNNGNMVITGYLDMVAASNTFTNNGTLTMTGASSIRNYGNFINGTNATLNLNGSGTPVAGVTTFTATATGNTVNYGYAGAQPVKNVAYYNLTLSNSGTKTFAAAETISATLTISGSAKAALPAGTNSTAACIILGGISYPAGTYGSTSSAASYKTDTYFTATTGIVTVSPGCCTGGSWLGTTSADWNTASNWCGNSVPTATTNVTISSSAPNQPNLGAAGGANGLCNNITINSGASLTIGSSYGLTVSGNWTNNGATFTPGTGTVTFNGAGAQAINGTAASQTFYNVVLTKTAGTTLSVSGSTTSLTVNNMTETTGNFTAPATLTINGNATLTAGTFTAGANTNVGGNWTNNGTTFTHSSGTVTFNGSNAANINGSAATAFYNLTINKGAASTTVTNPSTGKAFSVGNNLTVTQGNLTLQATDANYTVTNDLTVSASGTLTHGVDWDTTNKMLRVDGNVSIDGAYAYPVARAHLQMGGANKTIRTGSSALSILTLVHTSGAITASGTVTVNDNFWASFMTAGGTFATSTYTVNANAGLFNAGGTVNINGGTLNVTSGFLVGGAGSNGNVTFSSGTLTTDYLVIGDGTNTGTFSQSGGTANIGNLTLSGAGNPYTCTNAPTINITGDWTNNGGTFTPASSTVTFNGAYAQALGGSAGTTFNNLTINNSAGVTLGANETVSNTLTLTSGKVATTSSYYLAVTNTSSGAVTGYSSSSYVNGSLQRSLATGGSYLYPVGDASNYRPFELNSITCSSPVVRVTMSSTGASTVDATMSSVDPRNWYAQLISGSCTSATVRITEGGLGSTNVVAGSPAQSGNYTSRGGNSIGSTITSNAGISYTASTYFAVGDVLPPALTVVKSADKSSVITGDTVTYSITITNTGSGTAINVIATDPLPPYTTYVSNSTRLNGITVAGDGSTLPLIAGLLVDDNNSRTAGAAATGILPPHSGSVGVATITFQVTVN